MPERVKAWHDRAWLLPTLSIFAIVIGLFREDIRQGILVSVGMMSGDWVFDVLLAGGLIGLAVVLLVRSDRATRACEDFRQQLQKDLAGHRKQLSEDLAGNRKQLQEDLSALVDTKLKPISDEITTLQSHVSAFGGRLDVIDSRITALKETVRPTSAN